MQLRTFSSHWQLPWFAHSMWLLNLIGIGCRGEIRGFVLPGIKVTMCFCFKLGLVLVKSDCGMTAKCDEDKSVNTSTMYVCAFCETKSLCKNAKCDAYILFWGTNSHNEHCQCCFFSLDLGFYLEFWIFCWRSAFLLWSNCRNVCCITAFSTQ